MQKPQPYEEYSGRIMALEIIRYSLFHNDARVIVFIPLWLLNIFSFLIKDWVLSYIVEDQIAFNARFKEPWYWWMQFTLVWLQMMVTSMNWLFIVTATSMERRKLLYLDYLGSMLTTDPVFKPKTLKFVPTINMCEMETCIAWFDMRVILLDMGQKFQQRAKIFLSLIAIGVAVAYVLILLKLYDFLVFDLTTEEFIVIGMILMPYTVMIFFFLFYGSKVNERTEQHVRLLVKQKHVFESLMANIDTFDFEKYTKGEYVTYSETLKHSISYLKGIQDSAGR